MSNSKLPGFSVSPEMVALPPPLAPGPWFARAMSGRMRTMSDAAATQRSRGNEIDRMRGDSFAWIREQNQRQRNGSGEDRRRAAVVGKDSVNGSEPRWRCERQ